MDLIRARGFILSVQPLTTGEHQAEEMASHLAGTEQTLPLSLRNITCFSC